MADALEKDPGKIRTKRRERSPSYPGVNLETALDRAQRLHEVEGRNPAPVDTILQHWGYKPRSGGGMVALAALKKFGLVTDEGSGPQRQARLTDLALRIIRDHRPGSEDRAQAIRDAALAPNVHRELWERYREDGLPSDPNLEFYLVHERGFTENGARELIQEFRNTVTFAGLDQGDTMPDNWGDTSPSGGADVMGDRGGGVGTSLIERPTSATKAVQLPLTSGKWATLQAPFRLSEQDWELMLAVLQAMKPGLVADPPEETEPSANQA